MAYRPFSRVYTWYDFHIGVVFLLFIPMTTPILKPTPTSDALIRVALMQELNEKYLNDKVLIVEELGIQHGAARIDVAVINGVLHGYEIKSDLDTLLRLPEQMDAYNSVFDQVTLVVGKTHLLHAMGIVPDHWGIRIAKVDLDGSVQFQTIRDAGANPDQDSVSLARLLWRQEALNILEQRGEANGVRSKPRSQIYERLSTVCDTKTLAGLVRETLFARTDWRLDVTPVLSGG
jgi:hypothetical protein